MLEFFTIIAPFVSLAEADAGYIAAVFARISGMVFLLPGIGEQTVSGRVRLAIALSVTLIAYPIVRESFIHPVELTQVILMQITIAEAITGLVIGLSFRMMVFVLQLAGSIIAQNASISQIFGQSVANDTQTPISALFTLAGITLSLALGIHIEAMKLFIASYEIFSFGELTYLKEMALWVAEKGGAVFALALSLSAPFVALGLAYNLIIGAANRAMPQLMVAFVGAPAITGAGLILMALSVGIILETWYAASHERFNLFDITGM